MINSNPGSSVNWAAFLMFDPEKQPIRSGFWLHSQGHLIEHYQNSFNPNRLKLYHDKSILSESFELPPRPLITFDGIYIRQNPNPINPNEYVLLDINDARFSKGRPVYILNRYGKFVNVKIKVQNVPVIYSPND
jgi:hypothetical protein